MASVKMKGADLMSVESDGCATILREPLKCKWRPGNDALEESRAAGKALAEKAKAVASENKEA